MIMLNIGDRVKHIETGNIGRIVGYGYQKINDSYYLTTIKVELFVYSSLKIIAEDVFESWQIWQSDRDRSWGFSWQKYFDRAGITHT